MNHIPELFELAPRDVLALIGSGGKTSLLRLLAQRFRHERVLVGTTTKIFLPPPSDYDTLVTEPDMEPDIDASAPGIHLAGTLLPPQADMSAKLGAFAPDVLTQLLSRYDKVFLECDGANRLPLKAWAAHEPVVPSETTTTVGVITLWPVGQPLHPSRIHRLPQFLALTGAEENAPLTLDHIARLITHPEGLMAHAKGRRILLLNQIDRPGGLVLAERLLTLLPAAFLSSLERIAAVSTSTDQGVLLCRA